MITTQDRNLHQLDNGIIVFHRHNKTRELSYKIAFPIINGQAMEDPTNITITDEQYEKIKSAKTVEEVLQIEKKLGIIRKNDEKLRLVNVVVKETFV